MPKRKKVKNNNEAIEVRKPNPTIHGPYTLLGMPGELKNQIYSLLFENSTNSKDLTPLLTCRQLYHEAHLIAFRETTFTLTTMNDSSDFDRLFFMSELPAEKLHSIKTVRPVGPNRTRLFEHRVIDPSSLIIQSRPTAASIFSVANDALRFRLRVSTILIENYPNRERYLQYVHETCVRRLRDEKTRRYDSPKYALSDGILTDKKGKEYFTIEGGLPMEKSSGIRFEIRLHGSPVVEAYANHE